jgi:hypothetical protein
MVRPDRRAPLRSAALRLRIILFLLVLPILLRLCSVRRTVILLTPRRSRARCTQADVERVVAAVDRLYRRRPLRRYGPCLRRSLTLYAFLRRRSLPVRLALGAYPSPTGLVAHAWLTLEGQPIFEPNSVECYALMAEWGDSAA